VQSNAEAQKQEEVMQTEEADETGQTSGQPGLQAQVVISKVMEAHWHCS